MQSKFSFLNSLFFIGQGQYFNFLSVPVKYMSIGFQNGATLKCVVKFEHSRNKMQHMIQTDTLYGNGCSIVNMNATGMCKLPKDS